MSTSLTINIPKPCHEDWSTMTPEKKKDVIVHRARKPFMISQHRQMNTL
ncbi:hypothetical protein [Psychroserpens sp.]|jgi:hypothetical protein